MKQTEPLITQLFSVIKRKLKSKSLTYRDIAYALNATEISVKRWFSEQRLSVRQLSVIANLLGITLTELIQEAEEPPLQQLTQEQETALVKDLRLLVVARCVLFNMSFSDIVTHYQLTEPECIQYLTRLDQLRIIDLMPENQIRVRVNRDFDLLPNGPLKQYVLHNILPEFLDTDFSDPLDDVIAMRASLSAEATKQFQVYLRRLKRQLADLQQESFAIPLEQRRSFQTIIMFRNNWESKAVAALRRPQPLNARDEN